MNSKKVSEFQSVISNTGLLKYLNTVSISQPTQVQKDCIPKLLGRGNFTVLGRTGSGKTLGFLLPVIDRLKATEKEVTDLKPGCPRAVIIAPTRELALQIFGIAKDISHYSKLRIRKLVGGDKGRTLDNLFSSQMDILVTTPDRCQRAFKNKELRPDSLKYLVLDEADQLLENSFKKTMAEVTELLQNRGRQVFLVSASRPNGFVEIIADFFPGKTFELVGKGEENILNHKIDTHNVSLEEADKFDYAGVFLKQLKDRNGLVFVGNKARAKRLYEEIEKAGHQKLFLIHKDLEVKERLAVAENFKNNGGVLVSTDVFARGIDINHLQWVLNFDLPSEPEYYLHRSGRVGRAGRSGDVFNFVTSKDVKRKRRINEALITQGREDLKISSKKKKMPKA